MTIAREFYNFPRDLFDEDAFYRGINPNAHINPEDGSISSAAFEGSKGSDAASVDWAEKATPEETKARFSEEWGVARISALACWSAEQKLVYSPRSDNEAHSDIVGQKSQGLKRRLSRATEFVIPVRR